MAGTRRSLRKGAKFALMAASTAIAPVPALRLEEGIDAGEGRRPAADDCRDPAVGDGRRGLEAELESIRLACRSLPPEKSMLANAVFTHPHQTVAAVLQDRPDQHASLSS